MVATKSSKTLLLISLALGFAEASIAENWEKLLGSNNNLEVRQQILEIRVMFGPQCFACNVGKKESSSPFFPTIGFSVMDRFILAYLQHLKNGCAGFFQRRTNRNFHLMPAKKTFKIEHNFLVVLQ